MSKSVYIFIQIRMKIFIQIYYSAPAKQERHLRLGRADLLLGLVHDARGGSRGGRPSVQAQRHAALLGHQVRAGQAREAARSPRRRRRGPRMRRVAPRCDALVRGRRDGCAARIARWLRHSGLGGGRLALGGLDVIVRGSARLGRGRTGGFLGLGGLAAAAERRQPRQQLVGDLVNQRTVWQQALRRENCARAKPILKV